MRLLKRVLLISALGLALAAVAPVYRFGVAFDLWQPLSRPPGMPATARYVSALKDGAWFDCSVDTVRNVNPCRAWNDDGVLVVQGNYRFEGEARAATREELKPYLVRRGPRPELSQIVLSGWTKVLVPVNDAGEPLERFEVKVLH